MSDSDLGHRFRRRDFVVAGAGAGLAVAIPLNYAAIARAAKVPLATEGTFAHGISSGFPSPNAITLWTRVSGLTKSARVAVEVATDKHFKHVVKRTTAVADAKRDYTVHVRLVGLKPSTEYYYRFDTKKKHSRVGRCKTLPPANSSETIKI